MDPQGVFSDSLERPPVWPSRPHLSHGPPASFLQFSVRLGQLLGWGGDPGCETAVGDTTECSFFGDALCHCTPVRLGPSGLCRLWGALSSCRWLLPGDSPPAVTPGTRDFASGACVDLPCEAGGITLGLGCCSEGGVKCIRCLSPCPSVGAQEVASSPSPRWLEARGSRSMCLGSFPDRVVWCPNVDGHGAMWPVEWPVWVTSPCGLVSLSQRLREGSCPGGQRAADSGPRPGRTRAWVPASDAFRGPSCCSKHPRVELALMTSVL